MEESQFDSENYGFKRWFQDNLRIIISIAIVVAIAGGIYSYSNRGKVAQEQEDDTIKESLLAEIAKDQEKKEEGNKNEEKNTETPEKNSEKPATQKTDEKVSSESTSKETGEAFVETAQKGEGKTHLARRALANYLEKSPDSELTKEHKIYIEDYLRKKVGSGQGTAVGSSVSFSKELIREAIENSKNLNEKQLKNLEKYSARVPSLS